MIIDSHAHYDDDAFQADSEELLNSLYQNGIEYVINSGSDFEGNLATIEFMRQYPFIYGALGIHPCNSEQLNEENFAWLKEQYTLEKVVAVGEIGLDYYWDEPDREIQKKWFKRQLELAKEIKKPVIIHSRDAAKDTYDLMKEANAHEMGGVIHCFSYGKEMAKQFLGMDFSFGIGGVITFKNAKKLKEVVEYLPLNKIILETDAPYLAPMPNRGKRNSSAYLTYVAKEIAAIKGIDYDEVVAVTAANTKKLFGIK